MSISPLEAFDEAISRAVTSTSRNGRPGQIISRMSEESREALRLLTSDQVVSRPGDSWCVRSRQQPTRPESLRLHFDRNVLGI